MISFRFHVVSITAVFLAIAIGVVVGTTYVDRAVVENLENRIDTVSENLDDRRNQIAELEGQLDDLESYAGASAEFAVTDRLVDVPVLLLAVRGVDDGAAEDLATLLRRAGARTPGVVWMEAAWALEDEDARARLATAIGADPDRAPVTLADQAFGAVADALAPTETADDVLPEGTVVDGAVLQALVDAGFLSVDDLGDSAVQLADLAGTSPRVLVLTGTDAERPVAERVPEVVEHTVEHDLPTVVADVFLEREEAPDRGEEIWASLPEGLRDRVVVVDAADRREGRVAAVVGLAEAGAGRSGRYGYGADADGVLPVWSAP